MEPPNQEGGGISQVGSTVERFRCGRKEYKSDEKDKYKAIDKYCDACIQKGYFTIVKFCKQGQRSQVE